MQQCDRDCPHSLPTGATYYLPTQELDLSNNIELQESDQQRFSDFIEWIGNYNQYIVNAYNQNNVAQASKEDADLVDEFMNIDED